MEEYTDNTLITEVLLNFDQILRFTTLDLWKQHKDKTRQTTAGFNLNAKMKALKTINATEATALAIAKAAENAKVLQQRRRLTRLSCHSLETLNRCWSAKDAFKHEISAILIAGDDELKKQCREKNIRIFGGAAMKHKYACALLKSRIEE